jgi:hypothetical protein
MSAQVHATQQLCVHLVLQPMLQSNQLIAWIIAQRIRIGFGRRNVRLVDNSAGAPRA